MGPLACDVVLACIHHLLVFSLVAVLFAELVVAGGVPDGARLRQLGRLDGAYGALAGGIVIAGFVRAAYGAKGMAYYAGNPVFWAKIGVFILIGLISIVPTVQLVRWRKAGTLPDAAALRGLRRWIAYEVALLPLILILAVVMARGIGY
jgi:putative membrane protein